MSDAVMGMDAWFGAKSQCLLAQRPQSHPAATRGGVSGFVVAGGVYGPGCGVAARRRW